MMIGIPQPEQQKKKYVDSEEDIKFIREFKSSTTYLDLLEAYETNNLGVNCVKFNELDFNKLAVTVAAAGRNVIGDEKLDFKISYNDEKNPMQELRVVFPPMISVPSGINFHTYTEPDKPPKEEARLMHRLRHLDEKYYDALVGGEPEGESDGCHNINGFFTKFYLRIAQLINAGNHMIGATRVNIYFEMGKNSGVPVWWEQNREARDARGRLGRLISADPMFTAKLRYEEVFKSKKRPGETVSLNTKFHDIVNGGEPIQGIELKTKLLGKCLCTIVIMNISRVSNAKKSYIMPRAEHVLFMPLLLPSSMGRGNVNIPKIRMSLTDTRKFIDDSKPEIKLNLPEEAPAADTSADVSTAATPAEDHLSKMSRFKAAMSSG